MFYKAMMGLLSAGLLAVNVNAAGNLLKNPQFSECITVKDRLMPKDWQSGSWGGDSKANVDFGSDGKIFHSANYSAFIKQSAGSNYCHFSQRINIPSLPADRLLYVSAWIMADSAEAGSMVVVADTAQKKAALWRQVAAFENSFGWKKITGKVVVPAKAITISLSIRLKGTGSIWIDDCEMSFDEPQTGGAENNVVSTAGNLLKNPGLSGANDSLTGLPSGWEKADAPGYETVHNVKVISGKPNILRINWESGGAKCGVSPLTGEKLSPGKYVFRGQCRTLKDSQAALGVDNVVSSAVSGSAWQPVSVVFNTDAKSGFNLFCWNIGQGSVEFKNLEVCATVQQSEEKFPLEALVMPVENTVIWSGTPQVNSFEDAPAPVAFEFKRDAAFKQGKLVIELPEALQITEAYNFYPSIMQKEIPVVTPISRQGISSRRYVFTNPRIFKMLQDKYVWARKLVMAIEVEKPSSQKSFPIFWHLEADGKSAPEQNFTFNVLPALKKYAMPKNFPVFCWSMKDFAFSDAGVTDRLAENFERAGIKTRPRILMDSKEYRNVDKLVEARGWKLFVPNSDYADIKFCGLQKSPMLAKAKLVQYNTGKVNPNHLCPTWFNTNQEFKEYLTGFLHDKYQKCGVTDGDSIFYDIEPWAPMTWCFCEDCRCDFAKKNNLASVPSATEILDKYADKWSEFRCQQTAETTKLHTEIFKKLYPSSAVWDYDYSIDFSKPDFKEYFRKVAKDSQLNEQYFDAHISSYYHYLDEQAFDRIDTNVKNLKKDYYVICAIDKLGYLSKPKVLSPARLRMLLLATAVNGGKGFAIFPGEHIDGSYLEMFNRTLHEIAEVEDILSTGKRVEQDIKVKLDDSNAAETFRLRAQRLNNKLLVSLFNYSTKSLVANIDLKLDGKGEYTVTDIADGAKIMPPNGHGWSATGLANLAVTVPPMSVKLLLVSE
ncbi:MAG: hypothetical protein WC071_05255 [Victivallaceae bacterium]